MNNLLQDNLIFIVLFLLLIILLLMTVMSIVLVKILLSAKDKKSLTEVSSLELSSPNSPKEETFNRLKKISQEQVVEKYFCENHPEAPSTGTCLICEDVFCEKCIIEHESLYFCKEHFKTFVSNKWKQITDVKTTPSTPEEGLFIYHFKKQIWVERQQPSFVLTHYKINIEHDFIESYIQLNVIESIADDLKNEIDEFKLKMNKN